MIIGRRLDQLEHSMLMHRLEENMAHRLLIIDTDAKRAKKIRLKFENDKWQVDLAKGLEQAEKLLAKDDFNPHVICAELNWLDDDVVKRVMSLDKNLSHTEWIALVDEASEDEMSEDLYEKIEELSYDLVNSSISETKLQKVIRKALRASLTSRRLHSYSSVDAKQYHLDAFLGDSEPVRQLKDMLSRLAEVPISTMIITGETGTGKGLTARILHHTGMRKDGPMVELNCAALPRDLLESQLFGHEAGAFTGAKGRFRGLFEQADNGTLFLDEIGDLHIDLQTKLLKAIEDKRIRRLGSDREIEVDVQIIAATGLDLEQASKEKRFRDDLYHRLSVFCVSLPPLRDRKSDLVELVPRIIAEFNQKANRKVEEVSDDVWQKLLDYSWPGNVRELRNVIERCVLLSKDEHFPSEWLHLKDHCEPSDSAAVNDEDIEGDQISIPLDGSMTLEEMDSHIIQTALRENNFNITETARKLKTTRETLRYRIQKYSLETSA